MLQEQTLSCTENAQIHLRHTFTAYSLQPYQLALLVAEADKTQCKPVYRQQEMSVFSESRLTNCTEKRDRSHQALRVKMRMIRGWLEKSSGEWFKDRFDLELGELETTFEKFCDSHAELVNAVKQDKSQSTIQVDFDAETMENFLMTWADKVGELKAQMLASKGKLAPQTTGTEEHLHQNAVGSTETGQTKEDFSQ